MPVQMRNADQVGLAASDLQSRYEPNFAWGCMGAYLQLLGLRGWWSMGSVSDVPEAIDLSGQARHLSQDGTVQWRIWDLAPYVILFGNDWLYRADEAGLDTLGSDWQHQVNQGMTIGGWVRFTRAPGALEVIASKAGVAGDRSWELRRNAAGTVSFSVSTDGTNYLAPNGATATSTATTAINTWYFIAGRYRRGTYVDVYVNRAAVSVATAIGALFNSAAEFRIGATADLLALNSMQGYVSNAFLCAASQNDVQMPTIYEMSRAMYSA